MADGPQNGRGLEEHLFVFAVDVGESDHRTPGADRYVRRGHLQKGSK